MRMLRLAALALALATTTACSDSGTEYAPPPQGYSRSHSSIDDYANSTGSYGRMSGYTNPNACWRSTSQGQCF